MFKLNLITLMLFNGVSTFYKINNYVRKLLIQGHNILKTLCKVQENQKKSLGFNYIYNGPL